MDISDMDSALDSLPEVEPAGEVLDIPADATPDATPEGPEQPLSTYQNVLETMDVKDTIGPDVLPSKTAYSKV